jgi:hypothetical protein
MAKTIGRLIILMAAFVAAGTVVAVFGRRARETTVAVEMVAGDPARSEELLGALKARASALAGEFALSEWSIECEGERVRITVRGGAGAPGFIRAVSAPGRVSLHEATPAPRQAQGGQEACPEGFRPAGLSDWVYSTRKNFGEKVERRTELWLREEPEMVPAGLADCTLHTEGIWREPVVELRFLPADAERFAEVTRRLGGKMLAVCIDGEVRAAALVTGEIKGGAAQIRGLKDASAARILVETLKAGELPCGLLPAPAGSEGNRGAR